MMLSKIEGKIAWSTFIQLFGKAIRIFVGILTIKLITNALGTENYGVYGKISEFVLFFDVVANLGIFGNTVRKMSVTPHDGKIFGNAMLLRLFTAITIFTIGILYAFFAIESTVFFWGTVIFMASLLLDWVTSICEAALQANYLMGRATIASIAGRLMVLFTIFLLSFGGEKAIPVYFLAPLAGSVITSSISFWFISRKIHISFHPNFSLQKDLLVSSLPLGIINIFNNLYFRFLPSAAAAKILTDASFGSYEISMRIAGTVSIFSTVLMFSTLPALEKAITEKNHTEIKKLFSTAKKTLFVFAIAILIIGTLLAPVAISLVSNRDFLASGFYWMLPLLLLLAAVSYFYDLAFITLFAFKKDIWWLKRELIALSASIIIILIALNTVQASTELKAILVISSAIIAESLITILGLRKIKKIQSSL